jgi:RND family efflux transporter MFP subunit
LARNSHALARNSYERSLKALQLVEDRISKTKITAPFDCTILTRPVSVGQAVSGSGGVNSGTEVLTIADLSELIINAHVNQADVTRITPNQKVQIEVEAVAGLKLFGRVDRIAPQATIKNGIKGFSTRMIVKNDEKSGVRPGMTANLTIPLQSADNVLAVPLAAVFTDQGDRFVYVKQDEKFIRAPILIGVTDYDFAEVTKGLQGGEVVSLVTPAEEAGKVQQAFGAAAKGGKGGGKGGDAKGGTKGGGMSGGGSSGKGDRPGSGGGGSSGSGSERRGPPGQ